MLSLLASAALLQAVSDPPPATRPDRQARASVTILRAEAVRFGAPAPADRSSIVRGSTARNRDGSRQPLTLVEFY